MAILADSCGIRASNMIGFLKYTKENDSFVSCITGNLTRYHTSAAWLGRLLKPIFLLMGNVSEYRPRCIEYRLNSLHKFQITYHFLPLMEAVARGYSKRRRWRSQVGGTIVTNKRRQWHSRARKIIDEIVKLHRMKEKSSAFGME